MNELYVYKGRIMARNSNTAKDFSFFALRLVLGSIFVAHGAQKLFGMFGGVGIDFRWFVEFGLLGYLLRGLVGLVELFEDPVVVVAVDLDGDDARRICIPEVNAEDGI